MNGEIGIGEEPHRFREEDWISAADTLAQLQAATGSSGADIALATRAHAGLLRAHCALMIINGTQRHVECDVPPGFWWAEGHEALEQNWHLGDFETWIDHRVRYQAFGVRFRREDVEQIVGASQAERGRPNPVTNTTKVGRPMSALWPEWVAELARLIHDEGIPEGSGNQGTDELISRVAERLAARSMEAPARATVQDTAKAVLRRLRAEK